ncbi:MAG: acyltransferase [Candidatus Gastranaerophilales bacterium]|nr:acyltransferase [Candidatus Gastranaerophilales bacterium]
MEKPKTKILNYINVFRGLAILLIIMGHTMQFGDNSTLINNINCEMICGGTALFIFISGFLFQHLSSKFEYKNYLSKKWTNVIMPYLITSIPGLFFCLYCPMAYKNSFAGLDPLIQIPLHLTIGRVHNIPTWFIPMIIIFFIFSWVFLKLEKKNFLYKLLPLLFILTIIIPRGVAEYESTIGLDYLTKYYVYVKYILSNFVHFLSLYVFGMYCSSKKEIIDEFYKKRWILWILMISFAGLDIYLQMNYQYSNYTISKIFLTMLVLGYLKHYDEFILSHKKTNKTLDFIAKYSFGLFFIHWYWFFIYNQIFNLPTVAPVIEGDYFVTILFVIMRFFAVALMSILSLFICKKVLILFNKEINTRKFLGI